MIGSRETLSQPQSRRTASPPSRERVGAGAGGAGGGAALISIAEHLGPTTWPGLILLYFSPLIGILVGGGIEQISMWDQRRRANAALTNARKTIEQQLNNSNASDAHKDKLRALLEQMDREVAEAQVDVVRSIRWSQGWERRTAEGAASATTTPPP